MPPALQSMLRATEPRARPSVSVVALIRNDEATLKRAVNDFLLEVRAHGWSFELILVETGSRDRTAAVAREICSSFAEVRLLSILGDNRGAALRAGICAASKEFVICERIAEWSDHFHERALALLQSTHVDLVVGSQLLAGSADERPSALRLANRIYVWLLWILVGYRGTDTHGRKAFRRATLTPLVKKCVVDGEVFDSELVVRAYRAALDVREMPVLDGERRGPSAGLFMRVPAIIWNLAELTWAIRLRP